MKKDSYFMSDRLFYIIIYLVVGLAFFITLYPFIYIVSVSFSSTLSIDRQEVFLWPVGFTIDGYKQVLKNDGMWLSYGNTIWYTVVGTLFNLVATTIAAYPLSRKAFSGRKFLNFFIAFVMYFSGGLIPTYLLLTKLGFYNSRWVMIIPGLISTYNVMICRSAFSSIPDELIESSQIDGANDLWILYKVAIPLIKPTLAVITLYYAIGHWNNYFTALLYLGKQNLQPVQMLLRRILLLASQEFQQGTDVIAAEKAI